MRRPCSKDEKAAQDHRRSRADQRERAPGAGRRPGGGGSADPPAGPEWLDGRRLRVRDPRKRRTSDRRVERARDRFDLEQRRPELPIGRFHVRDRAWHQSHRADERFGFAAKPLGA